MKQTQQTNETENDSCANCIVIKKYANRRLYNTDTSKYITLEDLVQLIKLGTDFAVIDTKTNQDITHGVLTQIIVEMGNKGEYLLPANLLRQLIGLYDNSLHELLPTYLDYSVQAFTKQRENLYQSVGASLGINALFDNIQEQTQNNLNLFTKYVSMFNPESVASSPPNSDKPKANRDDYETKLVELRHEIKKMQQDFKRLLEQTPEQKRP